MALTTDEVERIIDAGESLKVEFKGERREQISDRDIYEAVVCLANNAGGVLLLGVENDGKVTGARPRHGSTTEPLPLQAAIFNNTAPPINTRASLHIVKSLPVIAVEVDPYPEVCATKEGKCLRRVMGAHGPECQPFYPYEHVHRRADLGLFDYSAQAVSDAGWADLDPLEIERLRQTIQRLHGDGVLLALDDRGLVQALRLVESQGGDIVPRVAGLLLLGREKALQRLLPTHEVAFQVLDVHGNTLVNDWYRGPLLRVLESVEQRFTARNEEKETQVGLFRLAVPDFAPESFREAVNNAVLHRDYSRRGAVHIQFQPDHLLISNPGGFLEGITLENLLVHEPKPRNPLLAEAFRRIGLVEITGRGIDRIYLGQLRYGRPLPDYSRSENDAVRLVLRGGKASLAFAAFVYRQDRERMPLTLDEMLVLNCLQHQRRIDAPGAGGLIQKGEHQGRAVLERLVERGLIEARGERRGRAYHLDARLYRELGSPSGYVRAHGFDPIRQEAMVLQYVQAHGRITRREAAELCGLGSDQASRLLRKLARNGKLRSEGERRGVRYLRG